MLSLDGDGAQAVTQILKGSQFLAAKALHTGKTLSHVYVIIISVGYRFILLLRHPVIGHYEECHVLAHGCWTTLQKF